MKKSNNKNERGLKDSLARDSYLKAFENLALTSSMKGSLATKDKEEFKNLLLLSNSLLNNDMDGFKDINWDALPIPYTAKTIILSCNSQAILEAPIKWLNVSEKNTKPQNQESDDYFDFLISSFGYQGYNNSVNLRLNPKLEKNWLINRLIINDRMLTNGNEYSISPEEMAKINRKIARVFWNTLIDADRLNGNSEIDSSIFNGLTRKCKLFDVFLTFSGDGLLIDKLLKNTKFTDSKDAEETLYAIFLDHLNENNQRLTKNLKTNLSDIINNLLSLKPSFLKGFDRIYITKNKESDLSKVPLGAIALIAIINKFQVNEKISLDLIKEIKKQLNGAPSQEQALFAKSFAQLVTPYLHIKRSIYDKAGISTKDLAQLSSDIFEDCCVESKKIIIKLLLRKVGKTVFTKYFSHYYNKDSLKAVFDNPKFAKAMDIEDTKEFLNNAFENIDKNADRQERIIKNKDEVLSLIFNAFENGKDALDIINNAIKEINKSRGWDVNYLKIKIDSKVSINNLGRTLISNKKEPKI